MMNSSVCKYAIIIIADFPMSKNQTKPELVVCLYTLLTGLVKHLQSTQYSYYLLFGQFQLSSIDFTVVEHMFIHVPRPLIDKPNHP